MCLGEEGKPNHADGSTFEAVGKTQRLWRTSLSADAAAGTHRLTWELDKHFEESPTRPVKLPENVERLEALERDGIVFIEGLFNADEMARKNAALAHDMEGLRSGQSDAPREQLDLYPNVGRYRYYRIDLRVPETIAFRDHPVLLDLVQAYMGNAEFMQLALEMRRQPPDWDAALIDCTPHFDHVYREVKIYFALEDITDEKGPIVFWTGTHRRTQWRKLPDYLATIGGVWGDSGIINHITIANLMAKSPELADCRQVRCTIKAGSAFVCDTRGIHHASYLSSGERWHISSAYNVPGYVRAPLNNPNWQQPLDLS